MQNLKIYFHTFGCRVNQAETGALEQSFIAKGYDIASCVEQAGLLVVNTCTVTEKGDSDCRRFAGKAARLNPELRIALIGCQAEIQREALFKLPNVRWVVGTEDKMRLPEIIENTLQKEAAQVVVSPIVKKTFTIPFSGTDSNHTRALVKIQDGCDSFCSFCIVPYARGRARSREFDDILKEVKCLSAEGYKEVVLTGIHVGSYQDKEKQLCDVIEALLQLDIPRIRISSIEPVSITERLLQLMKTSPKFCRYFHIPIQSGSETILKSMGRRQTAKEMKEWIQHLAETIPEVCLGTDVIVGFPGETDVLFEETKEFLESLPLAYLHVFGFSERKKTKSSQLEGKILSPIICRRSKILRDLSAKKRAEYLSRNIGTTQLVLFEKEKINCWTGLTDTYIRVNVKASAKLKNQLRPVRLEKLQGQAMIGTLLYSE